MGKNFSFIHTADIHLGDRLHSNSSYYNKAFSEAPYRAFCNICSFAMENKVDFILISGDLFHSKGRSINADKFFYEQCNEIAPIKVFVIAGNHDPIEERIEVFNTPSNLFYFSGDLVEVKEVYKHNDLLCRIVGQSYRKKAEEKKIHKNYGEYIKENNVYNIALLHTQLESKRNNYVPCSLGELKEIENINYWALGHIHKANVVCKEKPFIAYPGVPQGYDFGEDNIGGFFYVNVDENFYTKVEFIHCSPIVWEKIYVNIDEKDEEANNIEDIEELIIKKGEELIDTSNSLNLGIEEKDDVFGIEGYIVQWILKGKVAMHNILKEKEEDIIGLLKENLNNKLFNEQIPIWTEYVGIETRQLIDEDELEKHALYKEIKEIVEVCLYNEEYKKIICKSFGKIWTNKAEEECNDTEFSISQNTYSEIILKAFSHIKEKILESSD